VVPGNLLSAAGTKTEATYDIFSTSWFADYPDPYDILYHLLDGNTITPRNNFNYSYLNNPTLNAQIEKANQLPLGQARLRAFAKIDYTAMRNLAPVFVLAHGNSVTFLASNIAGYVYSPFGAVGADLDTLYQK
jgi:peptide/nickel transport system substrate-binding protein